MRFQAATLGLLALAFGGLVQAAPESPVVGVGPFLHMVADLDKSIAFYRDTLGLKLNGPAGEHPFTSVPAVANLYGVPGKQFRAAVLAIPGSEMGVELAQWQDAVSARMADPGIATLILHVKDLKTFVARAGGRAKLHDPDGFPIELVQAEPRVPDSTEIAKADLRISVVNEAKAAALYASVLGFQRGSEAGRLEVPGTSVGITFSRAKSKQGLPAGFPTPGRGMLRLRVRNIEALTKACQAAGLTVITTGGEPVALPNGARVIILRDPNNFYFQPMEPPPAK